MNRKLILSLCASLFVFIGCWSTAFSEERLSLASVTDPGDIKSDEPLAESFSLDRAIQSLDQAALHWQKQRQCFTCHTNYAHLYARPATSEGDANSLEVRRYAEELIEKRWKESGPRWDAEVVATAAALAFNDRATTGKLHPVTRQALDRMFTVQREDGGFTWIKCNWPPMESDDHYGATMAAIAIGVAPDSYKDSDVAKQGMEKLKTYLRNNPGPTLHHRAMIVWAATYVDGILSDAEKRKIVDEMLSLQRPDGGWGLATLGDWKRGDGKEQDLESSDGYGTGFVIYIARRINIDASDPRIQRGLAWLKSHQRQSGRWFTRSLFKDSKHYISNAGTAFALMALRECE